MPRNFDIHEIEFQCERGYTEITSEMPFETRMDFGCDLA